MWKMVLFNLISLIASNLENFIQCSITVFFNIFATFLFLFIAHFLDIWLPWFYCFVVLNMLSTNLLLDIISFSVIEVKLFYFAFFIQTSPCRELNYKSFFKKASRDHCICLCLRRVLLLKMLSKKLWNLHFENFLSMFFWIRKCNRNAVGIQDN